MAYGNWGAFVYKNGERQQRSEDATPYKEADLEPGYWQAFFRGHNQEINVHHAVLGEKRVRLCGYKHYPVLFVDGQKVDMDQYGVAESDEPWTDSEGKTHHSYDEHRGQLTLDGETYEFHATENGDGNMIDLWLKEPDGTVWNSTCGYCYGAGHMD